MGPGRLEKNLPWGFRVHQLHDLSNQQPYLTRLISEKRIGISQCRSGGIFAELSHWDKMPLWLNFDSLFEGTRDAAENKSRQTQTSRILQPSTISPPKLPHITHWSQINDVSHLLILFLQPIKLIRMSRKIWQFFRAMVNATPMWSATFWVLCISQNDKCCVDHPPTPPFRISYCGLCHHLPSTRRLRSRLFSAIVSKCTRLSAVPYELGKNTTGAPHVHVGYTATRPSMILPVIWSQIITWQWCFALIVF